MTQLLSHRPDAAEARDDRPNAHKSIVRKNGTTVNLDCVRVIRRYAAGMGSYSDTVGMKLRALKERTDLSLQQIADLMDVRKSTVQRFFEPGYRPGGVLDLEDAIAIASALAGKGEPPITPDDLLSLTALPMVNEAIGPQIPDIPETVAQVMAQAYAGIVLQGRAPQPGAVEALARMIREVSLLHQRDPAMRGDPARTAGALQLLTMQLSRTAP